jgi:DNA modification methylase
MRRLADVDSTMLYRGDLIAVLPTLDAESIEACVCDPPYELAFMGKAWDRSGIAFQPETWRAVSRVLKPGAYLLTFGGTRTFHRLTCAIEDAGFEVRDCLSWLYGSGFPKSLNVGNGQGTALKPAWEPIILARKPFVGTVAANVTRHSTGALNIDACRIDASADDVADRASRNGGTERPESGYSGGWTGGGARGGLDVGRWPANVCLDEEAAVALDDQTGELTSGAAMTGGERSATGDSGIYGRFGRVSGTIHGDSGGASRFYYVAKPSREERDFGCEQLDAKPSWSMQGGFTNEVARGRQPRNNADRFTARNFHLTVKPVELMRWLVKLVTPIGGTVLDPFMGSGTTGMACRYESRGFVGIEREAPYFAIAERRIAAVAPLFAETEKPDPSPRVAGLLPTMNGDSA